MLLKRPQFPCLEISLCSNGVIRSNFESSNTGYAAVFCTLCSLLNVEFANLNWQNSQSFCNTSAW